MRIISLKDFIIGILTATLLFMLLGASRPNSAGRYLPVGAGGTGGGAFVCVTDSTTGDTQCAGDIKPAARFTPQW
jgi:hypothetical protein